MARIVDGFRCYCGEWVSEIHNECLDALAGCGGTAKQPTAHYIRK